MPITTAAWIVASLALVGMFPFAGFFSKDEIIDNVGHNGYAVFMWVALVGAALTAMYTVRATYLTFFGEPRGAAAGGPVEHEAPLHASLTTAVAAPTPAADPLHTELPADDIGGEYDVLEPVHAGDHAQEHKGPHESGKLILVPICILAVLSLASGWANPAMAGEQWHNFAQYVEPRAEQVIAVETAAATAVQEVATEGEETHASGCGYDAPEEGVCYAPATNHAEFHWFPNAATSLLIVLAALAASWAFCVAFYTRKDRRLVGLTERVAPLRWGYTFLVNKYYLDALYEGVIVHAHRPPDRPRRQLGEPERHRRRGQRRGDRRQARRRVGLPQRRPARSSTARSTCPASSPRRVARRCAPCSRARSTSTVRCSSGRRPWEPSCS